MKHAFVSIFCVCLISSCGPNADEQKAAAEKLTNDSIAQYDSMSKVAAEMEAMTGMMAVDSSSAGVDSLESK